VVVIYVSLGMLSEDVTDDSDNGDNSAEFRRRRYDRKQNTRDTDELQQSLRQRQVTSQSVFFNVLFYFRAVMCNVYFLSSAWDVKA